MWSRPSRGAPAAAASPHPRSQLQTHPSRLWWAACVWPRYSWLATRLSVKRAYAAQHRNTTYPVGCNSGWPRHCHWGSHEAMDMTVCCGIRFREQMPCSLALEQQQEEQCRKGYASGPAETVRAKGRRVGWGGASALTLSPVLRRVKVRCYGTGNNTG